VFGHQFEICAINARVVKLNASFALQSTNIFATNGRLELPPRAVCGGSHTAGRCAVLPQHELDLQRSKGAAG